MSGHIIWVYWMIGIVLVAVCQTSRPDALPFREDYEVGNISGRIVYAVRVSITWPFWAFGR